MNNFNNITVQELKNKIDNNENFILLDVREQFEINIASLNNTLHIPMLDIPKRIQALNKNDEIIVFCKSGIRSMNVCNYLYNNKFKKISNLLGGIKKWSLEIDDSVPLY